MLTNKKHKLIVYIKSFKYQYSSIYLFEECI